MKGRMSIFALLCLLLCWMQPVGAKKISFILTRPKADPDIPLSMAEDAVDDMYFGCNETMTKVIKDKYFEKENTGKFANAWKSAHRCAKNKLQHKHKEDEALTEYHMQAICAYTSGIGEFYSEFNKKTRSSMSLYGSYSFPFHALHFWLTSAVQILSNNMKCHTTYRRSKNVFTGDVDQIIRFGFFASSSYNTELTQFGRKTCFKIKTCAGAFLKKYPRLGDKEEEVLIPPYEKFKIIKKKQGSNVKGLSDCEVVYILESVGVQSNLNCKVADNEPDTIQ